MMRTIYFIRPDGTQPKALLSMLVRFALGLVALAVLLTVALIGMVVVLPLMIIGGVIFAVYLRRKLGQVHRQHRQRQADDGIIDAEYTIVERRD
jgi:membrane protein implicated in regulation of membrane protease activity